MTFMCLLRRLPRCHYFVLLSGLCYGTDCSALFWLTFTGVILVSGNESKVSSTGCTKKTMAAVFLQAYGLPTKILLLPLVTNMISATSV